MKEINMLELKRYYYHPFKNIDLPKSDDIPDKIIVVWNYYLDKDFDPLNYIYSSQTKEYKLTNYKIGQSIIPTSYFVVYEWKSGKWQALNNKPLDLRTAEKIINSGNAKYLDVYFKSNNQWHTISIENLNYIEKGEISFEDFIKPADDELNPDYLLSDDDNDIDDYTKMEIINSLLDEYGDNITPELFKHKFYERVNELILKEENEITNKLRVETILDNLPKIINFTDTELDNLKYFDTLEEYYFDVATKREVDLPESEKDKIFYSNYTDMLIIQTKSKKLEERLKKLNVNIVISNEKNIVVSQYKIRVNDDVIYETFIYEDAVKTLNGLRKHNKKIEFKAAGSEIVRDMVMLDLDQAEKLMAHLKNKSSANTVKNH